MGMQILAKIQWTGLQFDSYSWVVRQWNEESRETLMTTLIPVIVESCEENGRDVRCYTLRSTAGEPLPSFTPGAHVDLHLGDGIIRSYSLLDPHAEDAPYRIAIKRQPGGRGGSVLAHEQLTKGERIQISAPRNNFVFDEQDERVVLLAGGIGITPIFSMLKRAQELEMDWTLHYAVPTASAAALKAEIDDIVGQEAEHRFHFHCDDVRPLDLAATISAYPVGTRFYCCGPEGMLAAFHSKHGEHPAENFRSERFSADVEKAAGGFTVIAARSGAEIFVPESKTILDALLDHGIEIPHSCCEGFCGTCRTPVLSGRPDHRDVILSDAEKAANDQILVCCSGSLDSRLELDI